MVPTLGIFEGQYHPTHDDWVGRYWDDGSSALPIVGWEGHDEGDTHPNAETSALSYSGTFTKITTKAAAELLGMDVNLKHRIQSSLECRPCTRYIRDEIRRKRCPTPSRQQRVNVPYCYH